MRRIFTYLLVIQAAFSTLSLRAGNETEVEQTLMIVGTMMDDGDFKKAMKTLDEAIITYNADAELMATRAGLFILMEKTKEAQRDAYAAIHSSPFSCRANFTMSQFHVMKNNLDSALWYVNRAKNVIPDEYLKESVLGLKGSIHLKREELFEAEGALLEAGLCQEVSMNTMRDLATVLHLRGKDEEAIIILKETLDMFGEDIESYINTGYMCNQVGFPDEAISYLTEALSIESTHPFALSNMAYSEFMLGQYDAALKNVNASLDNDNTNAFAYKVKGQILQALGDNDRACKEYKKAIHMGYGVLYDKEEITKLLVSSCNTE